MQKTYRVNKIRIDKMERFLNKWDRFLGRIMEKFVAPVMVILALLMIFGFLLRQG